MIPYEEILAEYRAQCKARREMHTLATLAFEAGVRWVESRQASLLSAENDLLRLTLHDIAAWGEGEVVDKSFDEPASATKARITLAQLKQWITP